MSAPPRRTYAPSPPLAERKPLAAPALVAVGGFLILLEALFYGEWILLFAALLLFVVALLVRHELHHHLANGITVLLLVFVSFAFGSGGFLLGGVLAGIGGVLAIAWKP